jgi:hypothetical protein
MICSAYLIRQVQLNVLFFLFPLIQTGCACHIARNAFRNRVHQTGVHSFLVYHVSYRLCSRPAGHDKNVRLLLKTVIQGTVYVETRNSAMRAQLFTCYIISSRNSWVTQGYAGRSECAWKWMVPQVRDLQRSLKRHSTLDSQDRRLVRSVCFGRDTTLW